MAPIWLASYPKSGNTWMRLALISLKAGGAPVDLGTSLLGDNGLMLSTRARFDHYCGVASADLTMAEIRAVQPWLNRALLADFPAGGLLKIHDHYDPELFPPTLMGKVLYLVRDPRDVVLSWAAFAGIDVASAVGFLEDPQAKVSAFRQSLSLQIPQLLGTWSHHVTSWIDAADIPERLVVRYEDMLADGVGTLARVATFLGWSVTTAHIAATLAATRFDRLQHQEQTHGFGERPARSDVFFRQGRAGGWRDHLPTDLQARLKSAHGAVMRRFGYE